MPPQLCQLRRLAWAAINLAGTATETCVGRSLDPTQEASEGRRQRRAAYQGQRRCRPALRAGCIGYAGSRRGGSGRGAPDAVKHFYFTQRGKRRLHKTPLQRHVAACQDWLEREIARVKPAVIVTLGATALAAVSGTRVAIAAARNTDLRTASGLPIVATYHPSAVLRVPDERGRKQMRTALLADLRRAKRAATRD